MTYSEPDLELDRFRDQYAAYIAAHPKLRIYALIDPATIPGYWQRGLIQDIQELPRVPLYGNTGLDDLTASGPFLIPCPAPVGKEPLRVVQSLLSLARRDNGFVSWLWTVHDVEPLINHLQTLLHARLEPEDQDAWFFFHQPAYLPVLHRTLPEETRRYMFGSCLAWWCLGYDGALIELPGENLRIPDACDVLPIPENVMNALHRAGAPAQVRDWLQRARPDLLDHALETNGQLRQVAPLVERALGYGMTEKLDQVVYVGTGLLYGLPYDEHPALQTVLTTFASRNTPRLIDAYATLDDDVWHEVATAARQRAEMAAVKAHQAKLAEYGWASLPTKVVNETSVFRDNVEIEVVDGYVTTRESLGDIGVGDFGAKEIELKSARIPIPGTRVTVKAIGPNGMHSIEAVVTGELPRAEGEGVAIVTFARNWRVYISMHAEKPKPPAQW